jgi:hypothetical protein
MNKTKIYLLVCMLWPGSAATAQIGMNLSGVHDYGSQLIFVDIFKQSRPWMTRNADGSGAFNTRVPVAMRPDGYPKEIPYNNGSDPQQIVHTLLATSLAGHYPDGTYTLMFEGSGEIVLDGDTGAFTFQQAGSYPVTVTPTDRGISLKITRSDKNDPIRNIRFVMPGFEDTFESDPFFPLFLERLREFPVLRFMETAGINGSHLQTWAQRKMPDFATQAYDGESGMQVNPGNLEGLALEYRIAICNRLQADLWLNIPHMADDDYITQLARFVRDSLDAALKIYVEYSNEIWNPGFAQTEWARAQGDSLGLAEDPVTAGRRFTAKRAAEVFHIFETEFGGNERLVKVLAGQRANIDVAAQVLAAFNDSRANPFGVQADALAIGAYFGGRLADEIGDAGLIESITVPAILDSLEAEIQTVVKPQIASHNALAESYGLRLVAYEGGQSLRAKNQQYQNNASLTDKLHAANRDPRMKQLYFDLLDVWYQNGGSLFCAFNYVHKFTNTGSWGALEWLDQPYEEAPKYQALVEYQTPMHVEQTNAGLPGTFELFQNYPNPFNPETVIRYRLSAVSEVELAIFGVTGRRVRTLVQGRHSAGAHTVIWDGRDDRGQIVASGLYLYRLVAGELIQARRMVLLR